MTDTTFDTFVRHAAATVSRRSSLLALGGAGLAVLAGPIAAGAKKKNKSKARRRDRRLANRKCQEQVPSCQTAVVQQGVAAQILCCDFLGECDSAGFIQCLVTIVN